MKAAFVLGLAVAANAQVDNEFATIYNPSGADLVRNAGWSQTHPGGIRTPIDYNTQYLNKYGLKHDDADAADDEMMVYYTKDSRGVKHYEGGLRRDDAADDELVQTFYSPSGADLVKYAKQSQQTVYRPTAHVVRDDETDNELAELVKLLVEYKVHERKPLIKRRDDEADDELAELRQMLVEYRVHERKPLLKRRDDSTDDELVTLPYHPSGADLVKYAKQSQQTVYRPTAHVVRDDEADDELAELRKMLVEYRVHERKPLINRRLRYVQLE